MSGVRVVPADTLADSEAIQALGTEDFDGAPAQGSLLDRLRRRAVEVQRERRLDLAVPGWQGALMLRFRPMDVASVERFAEARERRGGVSGVSESIEALAACCVGVYGADPGSPDEWTELADERGSTGVSWRLATLLGHPQADESFTVREVVLWLFGGNAFALGSYVDRLVGWMTDPDANEEPGKS